MPVELLEGLGGAVRIRIRGNGRTLSVNVRRTTVGGTNGQSWYEFDMEDWNDLVERMGLDPGDYIIFTRKRANKLWLHGFSEHGQLTTDYRFVGASWLRLNQLQLQHWETGNVIKFCNGKYYLHIYFN